MTEILKSISQKLQAGETLTPEEKGRAICEMKNRRFVSYSGGGFEYESQRGTLLWWLWKKHGDPFENTDDAIKFTQGFFSGKRIGAVGPFTDGSWQSGVYSPPASPVAESRGTTPSAAIMAACIEAFLVTKGCG